MRIKTKATVYATAAALLLLAVVSVVLMHSVKSELRDLVGIQQFTRVAGQAREIDDGFVLRQRALASAAQLGGTALAGRIRIDTAQWFLSGQPGMAELFDDLFFFAPDGAVLARHPFVPIAPGQSSADRPYFRDTLARRDGVISVPYVSRAGEPSVMLTAPVTDANGRLVGVLGGQLSLARKNFLGALREAKIGNTGEFRLIGRDRTIILHRDPARTMTAGPAPRESRFFDRAVTGNAGWNEAENSRGGEAVYGYMPLKTVPWVLVGSIPVEEAYAPVSAAERRMAIVAAAIALILAPLVWLAAARLLNPVVALRDAIHEMRAHPEKTVAIRAGADEIGDLARDFGALIAERAAAETAMREAERRLLDTAQHDSLTGLPNRALFLDRLESAVARGRRGGSRLALMYLDIDRFKSYNDSLGHATGDELLRAFAGRLRGAVRASDTVGRLGGDEFVILLEDLSKPEGAQAVADKILRAMQAPIAAGGHSLTVTTSIGVALADGADLESGRLLERADKALYEAKSAGRNTYRMAA